jgi:polysaccharide biosynthesis protein PelA
MKRSCCARLLVALSLWVVSLQAVPPTKSAVVYYGPNTPYALLAGHDYIIVQPGHTDTNTTGFKSNQDHMYAYISVGEAEAGAWYFKDIKSEWVLGANGLWSSKVMDISNPEFHKFMLDNVIGDLRKKGFRHFFFDTLDSYQIIAKDDKERQRMKAGLIRFVKAFHKQYPDAKLILNRGFEIIDEVHEAIEAVLFESLFLGLSSKDLGYTEMTPQQREWLMIHVNRIKAYGKPVIAVEYAKDTHSKNAHDVCKRIKALGIIPYIGDRALQHVGLSSKSKAE